MKKILISAIIILLSTGIQAQPPTLSWRVANPRIIRVGGNDRLEFEIQVKASSAGTYFQALEAHFSFTGAGGGNPAFGTNISTVVAGTLAAGKSYNIAANYASSNINVSVFSLHQFDPFLPEVVSDWYNEITTSYQPLIRVQCRILDNTVTAGILFNQIAMNVVGVESYVDVNNFATTIPYATPNIFEETKNLNTCYLQRIYCGQFGWSQIGGGTNNLQFRKWTVACNTSVWDTTASSALMDSVQGIASTLRIHNAARLKIQPGGQLSVTGVTEINEPRGLWISSDATGTGSFIDNGTITYNGTADAVVQRYLAPDKWHGYCIPLQDTKTRPYKDYYMKYYYETVTHMFRYVIDVSLDSTLNSDGLGYMMWSASGTTNNTPVSAVGKLNAGSAQSIPLTRTYNAAGWPAMPPRIAWGPDDDGWNMIGNPYPSAVDLSNGNITWGTGVVTEAYFWDPTAANYKVYIKGGSGDHTSFAPAQQGFFVHLNSGTSATFSYGSGCRVHNTEAFLKEDFADMLTIKAITAANPTSDVAILRFSDDATATTDENVDALKIYGDMDAPQLYFPVSDGKILKVNVLPWEGNTMIVPMDFSMIPITNNEISVEGIETFKPGTQIFLEDKKLDVMQDLVLNPEYQFTSSPSDDPARFLLHFTKSAIGIDEKDKGFQIYSFEDYLYVKNLVKGNTYGTVWMYDLTGRTVFHADLKDFTINKFNPGVNGGYYAVKVITKDGAYTQKVFLQ